MIKTLVKVFAGLIGLVALLAIAGIIAFKFLADPERVKAEVIALVAEQTGRELSIEGDLKLSFVPWLGFEVGGMRLSNEDGFGDEPFATVASAEARVRLWPLFRKQIEVGRLAVSGLKLDLVEARDGTSNWSDFVPEEEGEKASETEEGFHAQGIANIRIEDADIRYRSLASGDEYRLRDAQLTAGPLVPGEPFDVTAAFNVDIDSDMSVSVAESSTTLHSNLESGVYRTGALSVDAVFSGEAVGPKPVPARINVAAAELDTKSEQLNLQSVVVRTMDMEIRSDLKASSIFDKPVYAGPVSIDAFSPRKVMDALGIEVPETADSSVLRKASLNSPMQYSKDRISFDGLKGRLDDSAIVGRFALTSIKRKRMTFELDIDVLDADRYLPPPRKKGSAGAAAADDSPLPADLLRSLDMNGTVRIGSLKAAGIQSTNVTATLKASQGKLRVNPSQAQLYGGQYSGDVRLVARGKAITVSMDEKVSGVQAGALASDLFDTRRLSGAADVTLRLTGTGETLGAMRQTLSGDLAFQFADGFIEGIDVWYEIRRAKALFGKGAAPQASSPARTRYSDLRGTAVVKDGILRSEDFAAELPFVKLSGRGEINLVASSIDYRLSALVLKKPEVEAEEQLADLVGARIPVRISGDLLSPSVTPDIGAWARAKAEEKVKEKLLGKVFGKPAVPTSDAAASAGAEEAPAAAQANPEEALKQELEDKVKGKLKGLFGGGRKDDEKDGTTDDGGKGGG